MSDDPKTKTIATLGDPDDGTYKAGIYDYKLKKIENLNIYSVLELFIGHGVDIIRMNLAHVNIGEVRKKFLAVKAAMVSVSIMGSGMRLNWRRVNEF